MAGFLRLSKHIFILIAIFSICCLLLLSTLRSKRPPSISFPNGMYYDCNVVEEGESIDHSFPFENRGGEPLQIKTIKTGCACTGAEAEKLLLEPGEASTITVSYVARPVQHMEILNVWLETNDPEKPISQLTLSCRVHLKVFWYPKSVSFYCRQDAISNHHKEIQFLTDSTEEFQLGQIITSSERIAASCARNDKGIQCAVTLDPKCPKGTWTDNITIQTLVGDYKRSIEIPVYLMIN